MAEGTYGSPFYHQIVSPTEPSTPASKFTTSVTRKKTRKWVEAKKINYDGSGWGDDDDDDDDDEYEDEAAAPPMPAGPAPSAPRALPSQQSSLPSAALRSRNPSPLHLQTEQQPQQPPASFLPSQSPASSLPSQSLPSQSLPSQQPWRQGSPAPSSTRDSSPGISSPRAGALPTWRDGRSESPLGPRGQSPANAAGPSGPRAFVRPSDIYKRSIGQDEPAVKKTTDKKADFFAAPVVPAPAPPASAPVELPAAAVEPKHKDVPPPISKLAEPVAAPSPPPAPAAVVETVVEAPATTATSATADATDANGEHRFSSSPKLPDLARFSMLSPDILFGGSAPSMPNSPGQEADAKEAAPAVAPQTRLASVVEDFDRTPGTASPFSTSSIKSGSAVRDSAATAATATTTQGNTSSAVDSGKSTPAAEAETGKALNVKEPAEAVATASPDYSAADQVAPLRPNRASQMFPPPVSLPVAPMGPRGMAWAGTADTVSASATSSPVKESDVLREEIIRTLSPAKSAQSDLSQRQDQETDETNDNKPATLRDGASTVSPAKSEGGPSAEPTRTLTGESSYLHDVYDDYWTPDDASGHEAYTPPPVPPLSTANTAAASAPVAVPALTASPEMTTASPYNLPSQSQQVPPLAKSPSPAPTPALAPSAMPASVSSVPGTRSSSFAAAPNLRRRFSWEAEPESSPSPAKTHVTPVPAVQAIQPAQSASPAPSAGAVATPPASVLSTPQEPVGSPALLSETPAAATSSGQADAATERPVPQAQTPIRSMLDVGAEKPAVRSMLDFDDVPATPAAPAVSAAPVSPVENVTTPIAAAMTANRASGSDSLHSATSAQSVQSPLAAAPSSAQSNQAGLGGTNPALYGSGGEGTAQFLTLRQCMAFGSHSERMTKLAETQREYALADSGLSGWLTNMIANPEYSRASYAPLWDGPLTGPLPTSRPAAAAAVAAIAHVPHVNMSKSKEIFGVAAGKAGKGFMALRKKGFHKKSAN